MFIDERSQIPLEAVAALPRRLDAARIPTQPMREIGTYGDGVGIEYTISRSKYHFYPHIQCPRCQKVIPLHPKGCLLRMTRGKFLNTNGRPIDWFYHDETNKVETAYIGCSNCGHEISDEQRLSAYFQCLLTGTKLSDYLRGIPNENYETMPG